MYDIEVHDPNNFYTHFLELMANYFPMRNFQIQSRSCTLNVTFRNQPCQAPILYLFILSVNSYDNYKSAGRAKLIQFMERTPPNKALVLFFPSLLRVDEKVNVCIRSPNQENINPDIRTDLSGLDAVERVPEGKGVEARILRPRQGDEQGKVPRGVHFMPQGIHCGIIGEGIEPIGRTSGRALPGVG